MSILHTKIAYDLWVCQDLDRIHLSNTMSLAGNVQNSYPAIYFIWRNIENPTKHKDC